MKSILTAALILVSTISAFANDSAVETSAGGLKLRKEHSVLMKKERLFISGSIVRVEYEFLNTTSQRVVSEVAFPIPHPSGRCNRAFENLEQNDARQCRQKQYRNLWLFHQQ